MKLRMNRKTVDDSERLFDDGEPCSLIQFLETPVKITEKVVKFNFTTFSYS